MRLVQAALRGLGFGFTLAGTIRLIGQPLTLQNAALLIAAWTAGVLVAYRMGREARG
jgi:hypothetical protein